MKEREKKVKEREKGRESFFLQEKVREEGGRREREREREKRH